MLKEERWRNENVENVVTISNENPIVRAMRDCVYAVRVISVFKCSSMECCLISIKSCFTKIHKNHVLILK